VEECSTFARGRLLIRNIQLDFETVLDPDTDLNSGIFFPFVRH